MGLVANFSIQRKFAVIMTLFLALCLILPVLALFSSGLWSVSTNNLQHLYQTNLAIYLKNSLILAIGTALLSAIIGTVTAWLMTFYHFSCKKVLRIGLLLPLAFPSYILAITYGNSLDETGWVQVAIRQFFDVSYGTYPFFDIRSSGGAIFVLSFSLYPYVYILSYNSFKKQSPRLWQVAQTLGVSNEKLLFRLILPMSRPAIIVGITLVIMETLADYGVVDLFGVPSFTTGIYRTWFNMHDKLSAIILSSCLLLVVFLFIYVEYQQRSKINYANENADYYPRAPKTLYGWKNIVAVGLCAIPIILGFLIPLIQLIYWSIQSSYSLDSLDIMRDAFNTLLVASLSALTVVLVSLLFVYTLRYQRKKSTLLSLFIALGSKGYAIPGSVIAIGILIVTTKLDHMLNDLLMGWFQLSVGLLFSSSILTLIFAYNIRFLTLSLGNTQTALGAITRTMDQVSLSLGKSEITTFFMIHMPILKPALLTSCLFVFVDVIKELPATLILRPFNFDTLAIKTYELASDERYVSSAMPALILVIVGMIPIIFLNRYIMKETVASNVPRNEL